MRLKDRVAMVTGAARGIGQAYCLALAREGANVVATDILPCTETVAKVRDAAGEVLAVMTDVSSEPSVQAMVAQVLERFGRIASWDELGAYRTIARFPPDTALHPGLVTLLGDPANAPFVDTLEAYLDLAGDAKATAAALSLHRATLYYRLNRIEEITGARLKTGDDRLALHLGLRLARLSGLR